MGINHCLFGCFDEFQCVNSLVCCALWIGIARDSRKRVTTLGIKTRNEFCLRITKLPTFKFLFFLVSANSQRVEGAACRNRDWYRFKLTVFHFPYQTVWLLFASLFRRIPSHRTLNGETWFRKLLDVRSWLKFHKGKYFVMPGRDCKAALFCEASLYWVHGAKRYVAKNERFWIGVTLLSGDSTLRLVIWLAGNQINAMEIVFWELEGFV